MTDRKRATPDTAKNVNLWPLVPQLLGAIRYCVLATADSEGRPWATPVFFAAREDCELFWVSAQDSRHSRNIAVQPVIGITVFDSTVPIGAAEALYLEAHAKALDTAARAEALKVLNSKLPPPHALTPADLCPTGPMQVYHATVDRHFVLIRGGDARFDNVVDRRQEVRGLAASVAVFPRRSNSQQSVRLKPPVVQL
jgi:uncharacterized protein YhbP (UPF0306 family)